MKRRWWAIWRRVEDASQDARDELAKLESRDPEVAQLSIEMREVQRRNNFSGMVAAAIRRAPQRGTGRG